MAPQTENSSSALRKRLRDTRRLLKRENLEANVRVDAERREKALVLRLESRQNGEIEKKRAKKYHMIKFFEKSKVERKIRKVERSLKKAKEGGQEEGEEDELNKQLEDLAVDLAYIQHYPSGSKYISLFKSSDLPEDSKVARQRETLRQRAKDIIAGGDPASFSSASTKKKTSGKKDQGESLVEEDEFFGTSDAEDEE
ncbi:hypothetical protein BJ684DRAFT_20534 [Piptocephalis cylindrospora]|uniref:rRNA-processing protein EFG1 n=1 Tax=Piptocephalis cylindrospora TaxID=1907219 RepID=A0A4V1IY12_9FUNG|nr:hypothetical protein BJ684DRAFT_20534 [Piptocephalis cylindrospora]|eukprot:RKP12949.1 hypothetical protein BJ684DRAFT_20534 [Piptocephalis cylindrospora]